MDLSGVEVILFVVGVPLLLTGLILLFIYVPDSVRASRDRYRPGRPWTVEPMWLESSASAAHRMDTGAAPATSGADRPALEAGATPGGAPSLPAGSAIEVQRADAASSPVPGPRLTRARAQRVAARAGGGTATVVRELPGGARGTW